MRSRTAACGVAAAATLLASCNTSHAKPDAESPATARKLEATIVGDSMAPTLLGEHYRVACPDCQATFAVTVFARDLEAICCYRCGAMITERGHREAEKFVIERDNGYAPQRWDVVVFRDPNGRIVVKRVVGLPGERLAIRHGDIWRASDSNEAQRRWERIARYDGDRRDAAVEVFTARWGKPALTTRLVWEADDPWRSEPTCLEYEGRSEAWSRVAYRHGAGLPAPHPRDAEAEILDNCPFNATTSRRLNKVRDVWVHFNAELTPGAELALELEDRAFLWLNEKALIMYNASGKVVKHRTVPCVRIQDGVRRVTAQFGFLDGAPYAILYGTSDGIEVGWAPPPRPDLPGDIPLSGIRLAARGGSIRLTGLAIYRDFYYLGPWGSSADWEMDQPLGEDEYFVLGDNPPVSEDSRTWPRPVRRKDILGKVE